MDERTWDKDDRLTCDLCRRPAGKVPLRDEATGRTYIVCVPHRKSLERFRGFEPLGDSYVTKDTREYRIGGE